MFLRSLTLKGFKSFAEPTALDFEPGLTVVVGPNGSGKSNVVDAVAWVLGAQGPRSLRSRKMEDVIFAGNGRRPPSGRAEVSLTIDNASGILPIGFSEVTITRTLWRSSGESEYAINGVPSRLLDVQELLSDSGVGRQQHVIVSQGNLEGILDARPEDRRLVIEEAAGILKFRRRKEKAQRRLDASEANLVRLSDLLREVRRQMRPLERQAEAARRHGDLDSELEALRVHLAGRAVAALSARVEAAAGARLGATSEEGAIRSELRHLDESVAAAEGTLAVADGSHLAEVGGRLEALRERARGQAVLLAERVRSVAAELAAAESAAPVAALEATAAALADELGAVSAQHDQLAPQAEDLAGEERLLAGRRAALAAAVAREDEADKVAEARGRHGALVGAAGRLSAEVADLEARLATLGEQEAVAVGAAGSGREALAAAQEARAGAAAAAQAADRTRAEAEAALARAADAKRRAGAQLSTWEARAEGLAGSMVAPGTDEVRARHGVGGPLVELIEIDAGWETAVEVALGDALGSLVVDDGAARDVVAGGPPGLGLVTLGAESPAGTGAGSVPLPGPALRDRVRAADPRVGAALDRLLAGYVGVETWEAALDLALRWSAGPVVAVAGTVAGTVVSRRGDRFGPGRIRVAPEAGGIAAALALARAEVSSAAAALVSATEAEAQARVALEAAVADRTRTRTRLEDADAFRSTRREHLDSLEADLRRAGADAAATRRSAEAAGRQLATQRAELAGVEAWLAERGPVGSVDGGRSGADLRAERDEVAVLGDALARRRADLAARSAELGERRSQLTKRLADAERRVAQARTESAAAEARAAERRVTLHRTQVLARWLEDRRREVDGHVDDVRARRHRHAERVRAQAAHLDGLRRQRAEAEHRLEAARERARRAELDEAEGRMRLEATVEALRREHGCEPDVAVALACPELPPGTSPPNRVRELERELRLMGPVNPLAVEELAALIERQDFLVGQLDDVKDSRRELTKVIRSVEAEMATQLAAAYADVAENFALLFETLFPGGQGRLRLTDPDNLLESGIEVEARPGGKSPRKLSLLSGGERSLCAMAFLFAVFRSRPSPFYLLDEVEAALDDVNLHRFLRLLDEFRNEAQLLVVTHQKRTMEAADSLYGVTMPPGGSSKVISERVRARA